MPSLYTILTWLAVGLIAGLLADLVVKRIKIGLIGAIIVGILGGVLGGWLASLLNIPIGDTFLYKVLTAFVGAVILLVLWRELRRRR